MQTTIIYAIVMKDKDGGMNMKWFDTKEQAKYEGMIVTKLLKQSAVKNIKAYLSELEYDTKEDKIVSESLVNKDSKLLFES